MKKSFRLRRKINSLNSQISDLNKRSQELEHEIDEMKQSILYKIAMGFQTKFVERALPVNTRRRRTYDTCLLTGRTLINQGPSNLLTSQKRPDAKKDASESSDREKFRTSDLIKQALILTYIII